MRLYPAAVAMDRYVFDAENELKTTVCLGPVITLEQKVFYISNKNDCAMSVMPKKNQNLCEKRLTKLLVLVKKRGGVTCRN